MRNWDCCGGPHQWAGLFFFPIVAIYRRSLNTSCFSHGERAAINKHRVYACYQLSFPEPTSYVMLLHMVCRDMFVSCKLDDVMIHIILLPLGGVVTVTYYWHVDVSRAEIEQCVGVFQLWLWRHAVSGLRVVSKQASVSLVADREKEMVMFVVTSYLTYHCHKNFRKLGIEFGSLRFLVWNSYVPLFSSYCFHKLGCSHLPPAQQRHWAKLFKTRWLIRDFIELHH